MINNICSVDHKGAEYNEELDIQNLERSSNSFLGYFTIILFPVVIQATFCKWNNLHYLVV
jgi:hypothetical protein